MKIPGIHINKNSLLQGDTTVWIILFTLCMISLVEVYSASSNMSYKTGDFWRPVVQHGSFLGIGICIAWIVSKCQCAIFKLGSIALLALSIILLLVVLVIGSDTNGAARWMGWGIIKFQPSELAKLSLVGFASFALATWRDKTTEGASKYAFKMVAWTTVIVCGLIVTENFSTAGILFLVILLMCWYAQAPKRWLIYICSFLVLAGATGYASCKLPSDETIASVSELPGMHRFSTWANRIRNSHELPENPRDYVINDKNVQVTHAQIAIATCGVVGRGPGQSIERDFLPQAYSDFIYAIIIEEGGLLAGTIVMVLYLLLLYRAMRIAQRCKNRFPAYLVMGLTLMLVIQAMVNMAVAVGAMPVTGQPLPLVSKGGTSIFVTCAYIGMILSVSHTARQIEETKDNNG